MNKKDEKMQDYQIKPKPKDKFKPNRAKEIINEVLNEKLNRQKFDQVNGQNKEIVVNNHKYEQVNGMNKEIAESIKFQLLQQMKLPRYKYLVQVTLGDLQGQGVQVGGKSFWDYETDYTVSEQYMNDNIYCLVIVYAVYLY